MNANRLPAVVCGAGSHVGAVRERNEDAFAARADLGLWVVADGMGGAAAGDVAGTLAVSVIESGIAAGGGLVEVIEAAHDAILAAPGEGRGAPGMGTTVVVLRMREASYDLAWVGDSRAYLLREGALTQLTRDHSLVQELVDRGEISMADARRHPRRNVITRVLGAPGAALPAVDRVRGPVRRGDVFLLCTDGLSGELDDDRVRAVLAGHESPQQAVDHLLRAALEAGGHDNITAVVVAVD